MAVDRSKVEAANPAWRKSSHSGGNGECVEVAGLVAGIGVRDSKAPDASHLTFGAKAWTTFTAQARAGHYDR